MLFLHNPLIAVFLGGGIGSLLRYALNHQLQPLNLTFPVATLGANTLGAIIIGCTFAYISSYPNISPHWKLFIMTGFCGGLTTFSTFSLELFTFLQKEQWFLFFLTLMSNVVLSLIMVSLSFYVSNKFYFISKTL